MLESEVPGYRIFFFDDENRIIDHRAIEARDDIDAFTHASDEVKTHGVELWQGGRLIVRLSSFGQRKAPPKRGLGC
jgi:hypothetical protein